MSQSKGQQNGCKHPAGIVRVSSCFILLPLVHDYFGNSRIIKKRQNPVDFSPFLLLHGEGVE